MLKPGPNARFRWSTVYWIAFLDASGNRWEREVTNSITTYGRLRKGKHALFYTKPPGAGARNQPSAGPSQDYSYVTRWVWNCRGVGGA